MPKKKLEDNFTQRVIKEFYGEARLKILKIKRIKNRKSSYEGRPDYGEDKK